MRELRRLRFVLLALSISVAILGSAVPAGATAIFVDSTESSSVAANSTTTGAVDSTTSNAAIAFITWYNGGSTPSLDDSETNGAWTCKTVKENSDSLTKSRLCFINLTATDAAHTFTAAGTSAYATLHVLLFYVGGGEQLIEDAGDGEITLIGSSMYEYAGITPALNNCIVVLGFGSNGNSALDTPSGGYTLAEETAYGGGTNFYGWSAWAIQTTAAPTAPTDDGSFAVGGEGSIGSFCLGMGGGGGDPGGVFTFVDSTISDGGGADSSTTFAVDSTGANAAVAVIVWYNAGTTPTMSDSEMNGSWTCKTVHEDATGMTKSLLCSKKLTSTDAMHTFTASGTGSYLGLTVLLFDVDMGDIEDDPMGDGGSTYINSGQIDLDTITPGQDNCVVVFGSGSAFGDVTIGEPMGYTEVPYLAYGPTSSAYSAYQIQTTATATGPSLSGSFPFRATGSIGSFCSGAGSPPPTVVGRSGGPLMGVR